MSTFLNTYLLANVLVALAALLLKAVIAGSKQLGRPISYRHQLRLGYSLIVAALIAPYFVLHSDGGNFMPVTTQVWSATSMQALDDASSQHGKVAISAAGIDAMVPTDTLSTVVLWLCISGFILAAARIGVGLRQTRQILRRSHVIRRSGAVQIHATEEALVPFSCWVPGISYIVVPTVLLTQPTDLRIAVRHEGEHHRHGDTRNIYALELVRGLFLLNPAVHMLLKQIQSLQELACDEVLAVQPWVTPQTYCDCLLAVAQRAKARRALPATLRMAGGAGTSLLAHRIRAVLDKPASQLQPSRALATNMFSVLTILATGIVVTGSIHDRRISLAQAQDMAAYAQVNSVFQIEVNEQVLAELNRFVGTPDGRAFLRGALQRMAAHEPTILAQLKQHNLPAELLAVPVVESGYRNLPQGPDARHGAGIWMFVEPTARRFGLDTRHGQDQRLDVVAETQAAMKMLTNLHTEFGDWGLALLAFNGGSELVHRAIRDVGATDAFTAVQHGYENDRRYLARFTAALIALKNAHRLGLKS